MHTRISTLVLASKSPRRKELLEKAGFKPHILSMEVSEFLEKNLNLEDSVQALALKKARAAKGPAKYLKLKNILILGADTIVELNGQVFGKPKSSEEAVQMLGTLSGNTHRVITALGWHELDTGRELTDSCTSSVTFRRLKEEEISSYITTGDPMDKAGAYGIQGKARDFIARCEGPLDNVMGLSIDLVRSCLAQMGWRVETK